MAPRYGDTVTLTVCLGDDEWNVIAQYDPSDCVNVEEIAGPGGRVVDFDSLSSKDRDRVEQAVIDCYVSDDDSPRDRAIDRGLEMRKARLEDRDV